MSHAAFTALHSSATWAAPTLRHDPTLSKTYLPTNIITYTAHLPTFVLFTAFCTYRRVKHEACSIAPADDAAGVAVRDVLTFEVRRPLSPPARTD